MTEHCNEAEHLWRCTTSQLASGGRCRPRAAERIDASALDTATLR